MKTLIALALLALASATHADEPTCPMHAEHMKHAAGVDHRGDQVMGFSHEKTKHTFRLLKDGGAIEVRANDANDAESIAAIRSHLQVIAKDFESGEFSKPKAIHAKVPDGAEVMQSKHDAIRYQYEELERGARVRITTGDAAALDAVHRFLRFQIDDHRTGDSREVE